MVRSSLVWLALTIGCSNVGDPGGTDAAVGVVERATVFIAFEGVALQPGDEDATTNTSQFFDAPQTMQPYKAADPNRDAKIATVTAEIRAILAPYNLEIVTTRPTEGRYDMIVLGGSATDVGLSTNDIDGIAAIDCPDAHKSGIVLLFGDAPGPIRDPEIAASLSVVALGITNGIPTSTVDDDCMCWGGGGCSHLGRCTVGGANTNVTPNNLCAEGATTMDEHERFVAAFGLAP